MKEPKFLKGVDDVGITFCNLVLGRGYAAGIVNMTLGAFGFTPDSDGTTVAPDPVIVSRLRLTEPCAIQLRDALTEVLASMEAARNGETAIKKGIESVLTNGAAPEEGSKPN